MQKVRTPDGGLYKMSCQFASCQSGNLVDTNVVLPTANWTLGRRPQRARHRRESQIRVEVHSSWQDAEIAEDMVEAE